MNNKNGRRDETTAWPFVRWIEGRKRWMVDARTKEGGERRFFVTKDEALGWREQQRIKRANEGHSAFDDSELRAFGWTIQQAIKFTVDHLRQTANSKPVSEAVATLVDFKRGSVGDTRLSDIENRLARFTGAFEGKTLA
jgi:hypothetical protein